MRKEIRFAGTGGQGQVLAAMILAQATGVFGGLHVVQTQFYEAAIRGGTSSGDVVISDQPITFPWVQAPDILVAMHQIALDYSPQLVREGMTRLDTLPPGAIVLADTVHVSQVPPMPAITYRVPMTLLADEVGMRRAANMAALGAVARLSGVVSLENLERAVAVRVPARFRDVNLKALRKGYEIDPEGLEVIQPQARGAVH